VVKTRKGWWLGWGLLLGLIVAIAGRATLVSTSTDTFCTNACHAHPHATEQWIQSAHYANKRGVVTHCTDCHLPPDGIRYLTEKARLGAHDAYAQLFRDVSKINWARERELDRATTFTYDSACAHCHSNLFGERLSQVSGTLPAGAQQTDRQQVREMGVVARRMEAHLYYQRNRDRLHCVNCHLFEGHLQQRKALPQIAAGETPEFPFVPSGDQNYTEVVPGSTVKFHMIAVPGGTVEMGSPELGSCRQRDTGPARAVRVNPFWMAQATLTQRELEVFYAQRRPERKRRNDLYPSEDSNALTQEVARAYAEWLSRATGKQYRLPTEAELEYACLAGGSMPAWGQTDSRADLHLVQVTVNRWGFVDLPDSRIEISLDYPPGPGDMLWYSDRVGVGFRIVREVDQGKETASASAPMSGPLKAEKH